MLYFIIFLYSILAFIFLRSLLCITILILFKLEKNKFADRELYHFRTFDFIFFKWNKFNIIKRVNEAYLYSSNDY